MNKKILIILLSVLFLLADSSGGFSQTYPTKPIRMIVPFAAGGSNDLIARALQKPLARELQGTVVVENIPAGTTKMATLELMKSDPDGHTLMLASHGALIGYFFSGTYDYRVWEKMTLIGQSGEQPYGFLEVRADSPYYPWAELVKYAKKNPGKLICGGPGAGGMMNLIAIETARAAGIEIKYVPFAGAGPSGTALLGGHVDYRVCLVAEAVTNIRAGKTKGLGLSYDRRLPELPEVPTFKELGIGEVNPTLSYDLWGPPNLPAHIANILATALEKAVKDSGYVEFCQRIAYQPIFKDAPTLKADIKQFEEKIGPKLAAFYKK